MNDQLPPVHMRPFVPTVQDFAATGYAWSIYDEAQRWFDAHLDG